MPIEWIIVIVSVLLSVFIGFVKTCQQTQPRLSAERYTELKAQLTDEDIIRKQLRRGNKLQAIKMYRVQTGIGLKEAKDAIEMMVGEMQRANIFEYREANGGMDRVMRHLLAGEKIHAIKVYRQERGVGLKEAKEAVECMMEEDPKAFTQLDGTDAPKKGLVDSEELQCLIRAGKQIQAIKYYRETTGVALKEAKEAVEWLSVQMGQNTKF